MRTSYEIERDDFDRLIGWALTATTQNAIPSEKVWQRIVRRIMNFKTEQAAIQDAAGQGRLVDKLLVLPPYAGIEQYKIFLFTGLAFASGI